MKQTFTANHYLDNDLLVNHLITLRKAHTSVHDTATDRGLSGSARDDVSIWYRRATSPERCLQGSSRRDHEVSLTQPAD